MEYLNLSLLKTFTNPFLSAGSGMAWHQGKIFIIADDELSLFSYPASLDRPGTSLPLFPGELPHDQRERKRLKPDLESIFFYEENLFCFPSGSTPSRMTGVKWNIASQHSSTFDCRPLYEILSQTFSELNIEGSLVRNDELILFQRGNGKKHENALIYIDFKTFKLKSIKKLDLGRINGVPLSFTDAAMSHNKIYFIAVAENSKSTYEDGLVVGAILGYLDENDDLVKTYPLNTSSKPEGLWIEGEEFFVVMDDDRPDIPSALYKGLIPKD